MSHELTTEFIQDGNRRVSKLLERWDNRLILSEADLRERYVKRDTNLHIHISHQRHDAPDFCAVLGFAGDGIGQGNILDGHELVRHTNSRKADTRDDHEQAMMLIGNVHLIDDRERVISAKTMVRL